jgi:hypothetical protein
MPWDVQQVIGVAKHTASGRKRTQEVPVAMEMGAERMKTRDGDGTLVYRV